MLIGMFGVQCKFRSLHFFWLMRVGCDDTWAIGCKQNENVKLYNFEAAWTGTRLPLFDRRKGYTLNIVGNSSTKRGTHPNLYSRSCCWERSHQSSELQHAKRKRYLPLDAHFYRHCQPHRSAFPIPIPLPLHPHSSNEAKSANGSDQEQKIATLKVIATASIVLFFIIPTVNMSYYSLFPMRNSLNSNRKMICTSRTTTWQKETRQCRHRHESLPKRRKVDSNNASKQVLPPHHFKNFGRAIYNVLHSYTITVHPVAVHRLHEGTVCMLNVPFHFSRLILSSVCPKVIAAKIFRGHQERTFKLVKIMKLSAHTWLDDAPFTWEM